MRIAPRDILRVGYLHLAQELDHPLMRLTRCRAKSLSFCEA
jgi:hypothetical protein